MGRSERQRRPSGMFSITIVPEWTARDQAYADAHFYGEEAMFRELREAHRRSIPIVEFNEHYDGLDNWEISCPVCGSRLVEDAVIPDMGGTTSGWTRCLLCEYSTSWADLSAVI